METQNACNESLKRGKCAQLQALVESYCIQDRESLRMDSLETEPHPHAHLISDKGTEPTEENICVKNGANVSK